MEQAHLNPERLRLGARLRAHRTAAGLSRQDVAGFLSLSERRIGAFERGTAAITALELWTFAGRLDTPVTTFFDAGPTTKGQASPLTIIEIMAASDDGSALAEAFSRIKTPRLRRHLVQLAKELASQEG